MFVLEIPNMYKSDIEHQYEITDFDNNAQKWIYLTDCNFYTCNV